jgi:DNA-directed RNA polymerase specialized sigma24 family protein
MKNSPPLWLLQMEEVERERSRRAERFRERLRVLISDEAEAGVRAQIALQNADWAAAELVLKRQCKLLARRFPVLQEHDFEALLLRVRGKLLGIRKIQGTGAGYPAGLLAVLLQNAASELMDQRNKSKLLARISRLSSDDRALLAMRLCRRMTIGQIALELQEPYAAVASRIFRMMQQVGES